MFRPTKIKLKKRVRFGGLDLPRIYLLHVSKKTYQMLVMTPCCLVYFTKANAVKTSTSVASH